MTQELKACPFCDGDAEIHDATRILGVWRLVHRCKVVGHISIERSNKEAGIAAWNTRTPDSLITELKEYVVAFGAPWAVQYSRDFGLPEGHLHPHHYDILERCGARLDDFVRAKLEASK